MSENIRLAYIPLTILEIVSQFLDGQTCSICLRAHEHEGRFENFVGQLLVMGAHAFPKVIENELFWFGSVWEDVSTRYRDQSVVVGFSFREGHVLKNI